MWVIPLVPPCTSRAPSVPSCSLLLPRDDGNDERHGSIGSMLWAWGGIASSASGAEAVHVQATRIKMHGFMYPGDSAVCSPVTLTLASFRAACNTVRLVCSALCKPSLRDSQCIPKAVSSDRNLRQYLKRNHMEYDFRKLQTNANTSTWLQSKNNKQTFSAGFLKVCAAIEGLERGF